MMRLLSLSLAFVAVHGDDGSSSGAPSSLLVPTAPSVSFLPATDSPSPAVSTTVPITSLSPTTTSGFQQLKPNCGDCFCIPDPECLPPQAGLSDSFPDYVSTLYASFVPANSILLESEDGRDCYPFADTLQNILPATAYNESSLPQCVKPSSTDGYCAYVFEDDNANFSDTSQCVGRRYTMTTFETEDAVPSTASIIHQKQCGVCSSAQDLAVRTSPRIDFAKLVVSCGTIYFARQRSFTTLVSCFRYAGMTEGCAKLWSHWTATNGELCVGECLGADVELNGDPPECALGECLACAQPFQQDLDDISGLTSWKSGFTERLARNCSLFFPVVHDPCPLKQDLTPAPTPPKPSSDAASCSRATSAAMTMISWFLIQQ